MIGALLSLTLVASGSFGATVQVRAGYDSNLFFGAEQVLADPAGSEASEAAPVARDGFVSVQPEVEAAVSLGPLRFGGAYAAQVTQFGAYAHGYFLVQRLDLEQQVRLGRAAVGLFEVGEADVISAFRSARMLRLEVGASGAVLLGPVDLGARVMLGLRHFPYRLISPDAIEDDHLAALETFARWNVGALALDAGLRVELRDSNARALDGDLEQAQLRATWGRGKLELQAEAQVQWLSLPRFPVTDTDVGRADWLLSGALQASWRMGAFRPGIQVSYGRGLSNVPIADFSRLVVAMELTWHWSWQSQTPHPGVRPLAPGRFRLTAALPKAHSVAVVGSFQGWQAPGIPMRPDGPGHFVVELDLKPGRYRYQLLVDGVAESPPDAEGYEPDGLGGLDGVLTVPDASEFGDAR